MRRGALVLILALMMGGVALASSSDELSGLSNSEYAEYVRDRFAWLTSEARASHRLAAKFRRECKATPDNDPDAARACEIARAAEEKNNRVLKEGRELLGGLQSRFGGVPRWALAADAELEASVAKPVMSSR